jgi:hypothetical protein
MKGALYRRHVTGENQTACKAIHEFQLDVSGFVSRVGGDNGTLAWGDGHQPNGSGVSHPNLLTELGTGMGDHMSQGGLLTRDVFVNLPYFFGHSRGFGFALVEVKTVLVDSDAFENKINYNICR